MSRFFATGSDSDSESGEEEVPITTYNKATVYVCRNHYKFILLLYSFEPYIY